MSQEPLKLFKFNDEITQFFAYANIGNLIIGKLEPTTIPLNEILLFTKPQINGFQNPLYGILSPNLLVKLFILHSSYTRMQVQNLKYLSASIQMRQYLRQLMINVINNDTAGIIQISNNDQNVLQQVISANAQLIEMIDHPEINAPNAGVIIKGGAIVGELFNPNHFVRQQFYKLIAAGVLTDVTDQTIPLVREIYFNVPLMEGNLIFGQLFIFYSTLNPSDKENRLTTMISTINLAKTNPQQLNKIIAVAEKVNNALMSSNKERIRKMVADLDKIVIITYQEYYINLAEAYVSKQMS